jgi:hypothetical protein
MAKFGQPQGLEISGYLKRFIFRTQWTIPGNHPIADFNINIQYIYFRTSLNCMILSKIKPSFFLPDPIPGANLKTMSKTALAPRK